MLELQDIFNRFGDSFLKNNTVCYEGIKAMNAIKSCRTSSLGGHVDVCEDCGITHISYNSCRNRNCPKCGNVKKEQWIEDRKADLLPVRYFHTVFTVPHELNPLFMCNADLMLTILFKAASETLSTLLSLKDSMYKLNWVVYCKKPFKQTNHIIQYLGNYTHKIVIYNNRLVSMNDKSVTFRYKDYRDKNQHKLMTLDAKEFIRRFLMHVLPSGFQKIRYYGILSNRNRNTKLALCKKITGMPVIKNRVKLNARELILKTTGIDISLCKHCGGKIITIATLFPNTG